MIAGLIARGQEIIAESLILTSDQLTGSYLRRDLNDRLAALVKVQIPLGGVEFEGDTLGNIEVHAGEYFVFMPEGSQRLRVKVPGHYPSMVTFREINPSIPDLESARVYELRLRSTAAAPSPSNVGEQANYAIFTIKPENAVLSVDGQPVSVINGRARAYLPIGQHRYHAEAPGHISADNTFRISTADKTLISISLRTQHAVLNLSCPTPGVEFFINDQKASAGNLLMPGLYHVEARKDGAVSSIDVRLEAEEVKNITIPAITKPTGSINVDVLPIGAEIYIDNKLVGKSPEIIRGISVGSHNLELRSDGYKPIIRQITISANTQIKISDKLTAGQQTSNTKPEPPSSIDLPFLDYVYLSPTDYTIIPVWEQPDVNLRNTSSFQGVGVNYDNGQYMVINQYDISDPLTKDGLSSLKKELLPTKEELEVIRNNYLAINRAFVKRGYSEPIKPGIYWFKTATGDQATMNIGGGTGKPGQAMAISLRYSGPRDMIDYSDFRLHTRTGKGDLQVYDYMIKDYGYMDKREYANTKLKSYHKPRGIYVWGGGILGLSDLSYQSAENLKSANSYYLNTPTISQCDTINKYLDIYQDRLKFFGGDTLKIGEPYWTKDGAVDENHAVAYYFGSGPMSGRRIVPKSTIGHIRCVRPTQVAQDEDIRQEPTPNLQRPWNMYVMVAYNGHYYFLPPSGWSKIAHDRKYLYGVIGLVVKLDDSWFVIGKQTYNPDRYSVASYFGSTLPTEAQAKAIGENLGTINEALKAAGMSQIELDKPYWLNNGKHVTFHHSAANGSSGSSTISNRRITTGEMRQIVMTWPISGNPDKADLLLRDTEAKDNIELKSTAPSDIKTYWMHKNIWRNLPESQKKRFTPQK